MKENPPSELTAELIEDGANVPFIQISNYYDLVYIKSIFGKKPQFAIVIHQHNEVGMYLISPQLKSKIKKGQVVVIDKSIHKHPTEHHFIQYNTIASILSPKLSEDVINRVPFWKEDKNNKDV